MTAAINHALNESPLWSFVKRVGMELYQVTDKSTFRSNYDLRQSFRRDIAAAMTSVADSIADNSKVHCDLYYTRAQQRIHHILTLLDDSQKQNYITQEEHSKLTHHCREISLLLSVREPRDH